MFLSFFQSCCLINKKFGLFMEIISFGDFDMYAGGGVNLLTVQASKDFLALPILGPGS